MYCGINFFICKNGELLFDIEVPHSVIEGDPVDYSRRRSQST